MKTHRGLTVGAILTAAAVLLSACSTQPGGSTDGETLTIGVDSAERLQPIVDRFEKANPGVTIEVNANPDAYTDTMQTLIAAGNAPDIIRTFPGAGNPLGAAVLGEAGVVVDMSNAAWVSKLSPTQKLLFGADGVVNSVPLGATGIGVIWNDQALSAVGATIPTTFDELLGVCAAAKADGKVAFALFQKGGNVVQSYAQVASLVYGPEPDFTQMQNDGTASFADSGWVTAFEQHVELNKAGCFNEGVNGTDYTAAATLAATGGALGIILFSDITGLVALASTDTTFTMAPMPTSNDAADNFIAVADSTGFAVSTGSKNQALAARFLDFLATDDSQNLFANALGGVPALPNDAFVPTTDLEKLVAQYKSEGRTGIWPDQEWPNTMVAEALNNAVQQLFDGSITPDEAAKQLDEAFANG